MLFHLPDVFTMEKQKATMKTLIFCIFSINLAASQSKCPIIAYIFSWKHFCVTSPQAIFSSFKWIQFFRFLIVLSRIEQHFSQFEMQNLPDCQIICFLQCYDEFSSMFQHEGEEQRTEKISMKRSSFLTLAQE